MSNLNGPTIQQQMKPVPTLIDSLNIETGDFDNQVKFSNFMHELLMDNNEE